MGSANVEVCLREVLAVREEPLFFYLHEWLAVRGTTALIGVGSHLLKSAPVVHPEAVPAPEG